MRSRDELLRKAREINAAARGNGATRPVMRFEVKTAKDLRSKIFAPLKYIVPELIVEGLVLLAGKPKVRKSWMALDIGLAVASGRFCLGDKKPQQGSVLFLALEDGERRLQRRIDKVLPTFGDEWPEAFNYETKWPRADKGGVEAIDAWCETHPDARLIVIDVLARFRAPANNRANAYNEDYLALSKLQELATKRAITVLVIHHTRKGDSEDPVEEISGTLGLTGCADAFLVLKRTAAGATLAGRGRDTEDVDLAVQFDKETCRWTILGEASEVHRSDQRKAVLSALSEGPLFTHEIMAETGIRNRNAADLLLARMARDGDVIRLKRGLYGLPEHAQSVDPSDPRQIRQIDRSELKPMKEQEDSDQSVDLSHLSQGSRETETGSALSPAAQRAVDRAFARQQAQSPSPDYLGPAGDSAEDFK